MASSCTLLCRRCWCLRLRTDAVTLRYSTRVQRWEASPRTSRKPPVGFYSVSVNNSTRHTGQSWQRQIVFYYSDSLPTPVLTESAGCNDSKEMLRADAVVAREHQLAKMEDTSLMTRKHELLDLDAVVKPSPLDDISDEEAINISVPSTLPPPSSSSLRDYVDKSETLTKLVQLGVKLWKLEQRPNVGSLLLRLDFQMDVSPRLLFLKGIGVEDSRLGYILSHNPFILTEDLENLQARVNYLRSKKFSSESVASMVSRAPYLLNFSVKRLDNRLAFYQQQLGLSAQKTRDVVARLPRLLCGSLEPVKENLKVCKIEIGFKENEIQHIVTVVPKVLTANKKKLIQIFDYLHNTMGVPHHLIVKFPQVLNSKFLRIKERHLFLQYLGKAQYDPDQPNYISLGCLVSLPDDAFCSEVALATLEDLCLFQKSM